MKKITAFALTTALSASLLLGCSSDPTITDNQTPTVSGTGNDTVSPTEPATDRYADHTEVPDSLCTYKIDPVESPAVSVTEDMRKASIINQGNITRIADVMVRAAKGEEITIAFIGGSITNGSSASPQETKCYAYLTQDWWRKAFPDAKINYVNAGIGATDSYLGVHRVQKDVLDANPDLVIVEFSVNDCRAQNKESFESLLRRILNYKTNPAVVALFLTQENGSDYQKEHQVIAYNLQVPMVSYRNAVYPSIADGSLDWSLVGAPDGTHPNNGGHALIAHLLTSFFRSVQDQIPTMEYKPFTVAEKPQTLSRYENGVMLDNTNLTATSLDGFDVVTVNGAQFPNGWRTTTGGTATFEVTGKNIGIVFYGTLDGKSGKFDVFIDDERCTTIDANFQGRWGSYADYQELVKFKESGTHTIRIQPAEDNTKDQFTILAFTIS